MLINISTKSYAQKPKSIEISKMTFNKVELKVNELCSYIKEGYAFTNIFNNKGELTIKEKKIQNFKEAWVISYDVDHNDVPMNDFVETLTIKPTICYTTPSNGVEGYCFRLLYVLNEPITTNDEYKLIYEGFAKYLDIFDIIDAKAKDSSRYFNGSNDCNIVCNEENTTCLNDIRTIAKDINCSEKGSTNNINRDNKDKAILLANPLPEHFVDSEFINNFYSLDYDAFYEKCYYSGKYVNQQHTLVEDDGTKPIIELGDDFIEIIRKYKMIDFRGKMIPVAYKFKDGEGRRNRLWNNGMLRRKINPSITFEDVLYSLVYEICLYYDNSDGQLNKNTVYAIARSVMNYDINSYNPRIKKRRSYIASSAYCQINGISKRKAVAMYQAKKRSKSPLIEYYYREGLTTNDVEALINESGESIDISTIRKWFKKNVNKKSEDEIFDMIDISLSFRKNKKMLNDNGIKIDNNKLLNMIKEKKAMKKDVFESDEERVNFQLEMMNNKREREEAENIDIEGISSVPEPLSSVDPTTIREEEKEAVTEEINKFYVDIEKRIKPEMTWHEKNSVKGIIQMNLYFGRITNEEAKTLSEKNNCSMLVTPHYAIV